MPKHIKRPIYSKHKVSVSIADEIKIFQDYVRARAEEGHENTDYPTDWLVTIADALDHVKIPGRPGKTLNESVLELLAIREARWQYQQLRSTGIGQDDALKQIARHPTLKPIFKTTSLKTLKSKILRRKHR